MIEIKNLHKSFGKKKVIDNFNLSINEGERVAIISNSGSGKTTILRIISGLEKKYSGECKVFGRISYMFQEDRLFPFSTVFENVMAVTDSKVIAEELLRDVELYDSASLLPDSLSGGMKRRCALARALAYDFDVLLLDEPFVGLDDELKNRIIGKLSQRIGDRTLLLVSHSREEAELLGCKIINYENGFLL